MHLRAVLVAALIILTAVPFAVADTFVRPPETSLPPGAWDGPFPYQRNAKMDFTTDPNGWPLDANMPVARELDPAAGNYILEGTRDPDVYESDYLYWAGPLEWHDTDPTGTSSRQGLIGLYDQEGTGIQILWHVDNLPDPGSKKHIYLEVEFYYGGSGTWEAQLVPGDGAQLVAGVELPDVSLGDGWWLWNGWAEIRPNPTYEDFYFDFRTDPTTPGTVLIDHMHVATECVPEPGTFLLFGLGAGGLVIWRRRKR